MRMAFQKADPVIQIINGDEEDVRSPRISGVGTRGIEEGEQQEEIETFHGRSRLSRSRKLGKQMAEPRWIRFFRSKFGSWKPLMSAE